MGETGTVYALAASPDDPPYYIGRTKRDPLYRGREHRWARKRVTWNKTLQALLYAGMPHVVILAEVGAADLVRTERELIVKGRALGWPLANILPRSR